MSRPMGWQIGFPWPWHMGQKGFTCQWVSPNPPTYLHAHSSRGAHHKDVKDTHLHVMSSPLLFLVWHPILRPLQK